MPLCLAYNFDELACDDMLFFQIGLASKIGALPTDIQGIRPEYTGIWRRDTTAGRTRLSIKRSSPILEVEPDLVRR